MGKFICDFGEKEIDRATILKAEDLNDMAVSAKELCSYSIEDIKKYVQQLDKANINVIYVSSLIGYKIVDSSEITKIFILAKQAKIRYVVCYGYAKSSGLSIDEAVEQYKEIVLLAKQYGLTLLIRNHHDSILNRADYLLDFVKKLESSICHIFFDTAEFVRCNELILPAYRHVKEEVEMIFLSDINSFYDEVPFGIGKGKISDFIAVLKKDGYKGLISININFPTYEKREEIYKKTNIFTMFKKSYKSCLLIDEKLGKTKKDEITIKYLSALQIRYIKKLF